MYLEIQHADVRGGTAVLPHEATTQVHHEEGQVHGVRHGDVFDDYEVLQAPVLFRVTKRTLDLEPQLVIVAQDIPGQNTVAAEEVDVCLLPGGLLTLGADHHGQRLVKRLMAGFDLVDPRRDVLLHGGLFMVSPTIRSKRVLFSRYACSVSP